MKKREGGTGVRRALALAGWLCVGSAMRGDAVQGTLIRAVDGQPINGDIRWRGEAKEYVITASGVSMTIPLAQVKEVKTPQPAGFDAAVAAFNARKHQEALAEFEKIMDAYKMLQWDVPATGYAARSHLALGNAARAVTLCETLVRDNPAAAYEGDLAGVYWQALIEAGREATLRQLLDKAVQEGSRELAALAQIRRGDIDMKNGRFKEALVDGYLRTVVLFEGVKQHLPEALYKAAQCFQQINETSNADKMRKRLLEEFPSSPFAQNVQMGK